MTRPIAIVFGGGGARAAYQVGLLRGLSRRMPDARISVYTGVSMGAINAAYMARAPGPFAAAVRSLASLWGDLDYEHVFRTDLGWLGRLAWSRARRAFGGGRPAPGTEGLLETSPLRSYLANALEDSAEGMRGIAENLARGELSAVAVTTTDLSTGRTMTWLQSSRPVTWEGRIHRGVSTTLRVDHLLASLATPVFFPAVRLGNSWHVDGAIRQFAPLLPAMRLGAERILAISCRHVEQSPGETESAEYPPLIQVGGVLLNAVFQTLLDEEVESINQLSAVLEKLPERDRAGLRPGRVLVVRPSRDLGAMAGPHLRRFPSLLGFVARQMTAGDPRNLDLLSSAVFDRQFIGELMELGERDAEAQSAGIEDLLREP